MNSNPAYYKSKRDEVAVLMPDEYHNVLEIGCGEGNFSLNLKSWNELWGVELNETAAEKASKKGYRMIKGNYKKVSYQLPDNYFDLVICNDVIEHMADHDAFLCSIRKKMRPNAYMIGSVPNMRYYLVLKKLIFRRDWEYTDNSILDRTHLRYFTEKSLIRTLNQHNFQIEKFVGLKKLQLREFKFGLNKLIHIFIIYSAIALSFGKHSDIMYVQFGFRVKKS